MSSALSREDWTGPEGGAAAPAVAAARTSDEVSSLRAPWERLKGTGVSASLFTDIDYFLSAAAAGEDTVRPHVITLDHRSAGDLIVAGTIRRILFTPTIGYLKLKLFRKPRHCLYIPPGGILGDGSSDGAAGLIADRLLEELADPGIDWIYASRLPLDSPLARRLLRAPGFFARDRFPTISTNFTMTIPNDPAAFFAARSKNHRKNIRKLLNKLEKDFPGAVRIETVREPGGVDRFCADAETIAAGTYQRGIGVGFVDTPGERQRQRAAAGRGMLRSYMLTVEERPVSFLCGLQSGDTFFAENIGYVKEMERYKVGTYLFVRIVEDLCGEEGLRRLDFGPGTGTWKERYADESLRDISIRVFAPGFTGAAMNATRSFAEIATRLGRTASRGTGLYGRLKRGWRGLAGRGAKNGGSGGTR